MYGYEKCFKGTIENPIPAFKVTTGVSGSCAITGEHMRMNKNKIIEFFIVGFRLTSDL